MSKAHPDPFVTEVGVGVNTGRKQKRVVPVGSKGPGYRDSCSSKAGAHTPRSEPPKFETPNASVLPAATLSSLCLKR